MSTSIQDKINELDKPIFDPDRDDGSILSDIDPDINILFNMNDTIQNSSKYMDNSRFRTSFKMYKNNLSILNANIRGMVTNFDKLKLLIDDLDYTFPIIGISETWLRTHNVDCFFMNGYSHEYDIRQNKAGGGVSFFIENRLIYTRRIKPNILLYYNRYR